jgi:hypothetical protein
MNIDNLIQQLINLKSQGAETVNVVDSNWNDYEIDSVTPNNEGTEVLLVVSLAEI